MDTIRCFYCKERLTDNILEHSYKQHPDETFSLLVKVDEKHYVPKLYNIKPAEHPKESLHFNKETYKITYKHDPSNQNSPIKKQQRLSCTPQKDLPKQELNDIPESHEIGMDEDGRESDVGKERHTKINIFG